MASSITVHMVTSLDGFIASSDNSMDWFECSWSSYDRGVEEEDAEQFLAGIDCYIMGSHTYELALRVGWPYGTTPAIVLSSRPLQSRQNVLFYSGDLTSLISGIVKPKYTNTWLVGGASVCREFLKQSLVDEISLTTVPILLGSGLALFDGAGLQSKLLLKDCRAYKNGMIEQRYTFLPEKKACN